MGNIGKRAAIYLRVSTFEQNIENQRPEVERIAKVRELEVVKTFEEHISATKKRPAYDAMMKDAHRGKFDVLIIWSLDRLGRSMYGNIGAVVALDQCGVRIVSAQEPWLDSGGPTRQLLIAIFSWVAEQERIRLIQRTTAGIERARKRGVHLGRPFASISKPLMLQLRAHGASVRNIAKALSTPGREISASAVQRALKLAGAPPPPKPAPAIEANGVCHNSDDPILY
jgi:DNA invertase Pin-like site-specific DNA recombinase